MTNELITLVEWCKTVHIDIRIARRYARSGKWDAVRKLYGRIVIPANAPVPEFPTPTSRGKSRDDGRQRWIVYMNDAECDVLIASGIVAPDCIVNPRERARARRAARNNGGDTNNDN